jgi:hypothetical protein
VVGNVTGVTDAINCIRHPTALGCIKAVVKLGLTGAAVFTAGSSLGADAVVETSVEGGAAAVEGTGAAVSGGGAAVSGGGAAVSGSGAAVESSGVTSGEVSAWTPSTSTSLRAAQSVGESSSPGVVRRTLAAATICVRLFCGGADVATEGTSALDTLALSQANAAVHSEWDLVESDPLLEGGSSIRMITRPPDF